MTDLDSTSASALAAERVVALLELGGSRDYSGERVSQLAHALQAAHLATRAGRPDCEILAALLHDLGHICAADDAPRMDDVGVARHEHIGADYLAALGVGPDVTAPIRAHVDAKRYLVATRPDYAARLSEASTHTLRHQGGPMTPSEQASFEAAPFFDAALRLRSWDEQAKAPGREVPDLESYRPLLVHFLNG